MKLATALFALMATSAFAADDPMASYYGNTIVSTGGMGEVHSHYRADHSFDMVGSAMGMTMTFKGTWAEDGKGNICRTFTSSPPPGTPNPLCRPLPPHKIGDTWTMTQPDGSTRTLSLKAGVQ